MKVTREINNIQIQFFFAYAIMRGLTMWFFDGRWATKRNDNFMQKTKTIAINAIVNMNLLVLLLFLQFTSSTDSFRIKWINQCYRKCILFWVQSYLIGGKAASTAATEKKLCKLCKNINVHNFFLFLFIKYPIITSECCHHHISPLLIYINVAILMKTVWTKCFLKSFF